MQVGGQVPVGELLDRLQGHIEVVGVESCHRSRTGHRTASDNVAAERTVIVADPSLSVFCSQ